MFTCQVPRKPFGLILEILHTNFRLVVDQIFSSAAIRLCRKELKLTLIITDMIAMRGENKLQEFILKCGLTII